jgi:hypothetical protein
MSESQLIGNRVVEAMASYRERVGRAPSRLSELVPGYLDNVPDTALGLTRRVPFSYSPDAFGGPSLSFPAPGWLNCTRSIDRGWVCAD